MKRIIGIFAFLIFILTGCAAEKDVETDVDTDVAADNTNVNEGTREDDDRDNEKNIHNELDDLSVNDDEISGPIKNFIGDWKIKAYSNEDFGLTEELDSQESGIGIHKDYLVIYACEVNDYILLRYDIEEIDEDNVLAQYIDENKDNIVLGIKEKETSFGRKKTVDTKILLTLDKNNKNILKCTFAKETEYGTSISTYIYEKDTQGVYNKFYIDKQKNNEDFDKNNELIKKIQNEWFLDYDSIKEDEFLRINEDKGITSYYIEGSSIYSKIYDLKGNLSWQSGERNYQARCISGDSVVLEVMKEQGNLDDIIGVYYLIQFKNDEVTIQEFDYFSDVMFRFNDEKVVDESLESMVTIVGHKNNLFAFNNEQKILFNKLIGRWGTLEVEDYDTYKYNLVIDNYYMDFYEYATGFMEAINFTVEDIDIDKKEVLLKINQYTWSDELNGETKYVDNFVKILLNEEESKLTVTIMNDEGESKIFDMGEENIENVEFEKMTD